jgi:hypothetical protein
MMSGIAAFLAAVCGTLLICYALMTRVQNRSARRRGAAGDHSGTNSAGYDSGGDGWNILSWLGGNTAASDSGGTSDDAGGGDSGGGDGGGGD